MARIIVTEEVRELFTPAEVAQVRALLNGETA